MCQTEETTSRPAQGRGPVLWECLINQQQESSCGETVHLNDEKFAATCVTQHPLWGRPVSAFNEQKQAEMRVNTGKSKVGGNGRSPHRSRPC